MAHVRRRNASRMSSRISQRMRSRRNQCNGWSTPQMLTWYGASAASARARRHYDQIMNHRPRP